MEKKLTDFIGSSSQGSKTLTREELERVLKKAADLIRTRVDYKYILLLLFLKRLSDEWEKEFEEYVRKLTKEGLDRKTAEELALKDREAYTINYPPEYLWRKLREKDIESLPQNLSQALKKLAELNPNLRGVVDRFDFMEFMIHRDNAEILRQLFELFSGLDLKNASPDVLGDAYEWILRYFAPQKAKEGEVYTPREVIRLLVEILKPEPGEEVYDPAMGSGGMLIGAYLYVKEKHGEREAKKLFLYGQEVNPTTYALAEMNMILHGIKSPKLATGDTLLRPQFKENERLKRFNVVIANPPWNQDGYGEETLKKAEFTERFKYGYPPNNSADWAWIQHMLASAKDTGRVGIVIDNGALFRGGAEKKIRAKILREDLLEAVILLPEKLFYNTGAPGAVMIFNRNKPEDRKGKVLFINASQEYEKHPEIRKLNRLGKGHIKKIVEAFEKFEDIEGFARVVELDEIKENDYNLNVTLYVFPMEEEEEIDVKAEWEELRRINEELARVDERIEGYLRELGYWRD